MISRGTDSRVRDCGHREAVGAATQDQHLTLAASWWRHASRRSLHGQRARCAGTAWGGPVRAGRSERTVHVACAWVQWRTQPGLSPLLTTGRWPSTEQLAAAGETLTRACAVDVMLVNSTSESAPVAIAVESLTACQCRQRPWRGSDRVSSSWSHRQRHAGDVARLPSTNCYRCMTALQGLVPPPHHVTSDMDRAAAHARSSACCH